MQEVPGPGPEEAGMASEDNVGGVEKDENEEGWEEVPSLVGSLDEVGKRAAKEANAWAKENPSPDEEARLERRLVEDGKVEYRWSAAKK